MEIRPNSSLRQSLSVHSVTMKHTVTPDCIYHHSWRSLMLLAEKHLANIQTMLTVLVTVEELRLSSLSVMFRASSRSMSEIKMNSFYSAVTDMCSVVSTVVGCSLLYTNPLLTLSPDKCWQHYSPKAH